MRLLASSALKRAAVVFITLREAFENVTEFLILWIFCIISVSEDSAFEKLTYINPSTTVTLLMGIPN
jgi:hypothetical protein